MFHVAKKRGRPLLLVLKISENLQGCHLDIIDIETWTSKQLAGLLILGVRSIDLAIQDFRRITIGTNIKLHPHFDDPHGSDGYVSPPLEVLRGVYANWRNQGADGVSRFNWAYARGKVQQAAAKAARLLGSQAAGEQRWETFFQAYREIGAPETLAAQDKAFVVPRRGDGHSNVPIPDDWHTPRAHYFKTNAFGQLPVVLDDQTKVDALITLQVSDQLTVLADRISDLTLRVILSDPGTKSLPEKQTIGRAEIRRYDGGLFWYTTPLTRDIVKHLEVRLNGGLLREPVVEDGWLVFRPDPKQFAVKINLVGIVPKGPAGTTDDKKLPPQWWVDMNELKLKAVRTMPFRPPAVPLLRLKSSICTSSTVVNDYHRKGKLNSRI